MWVHSLVCKRFVWPSEHDLHWDPGAVCSSGWPGTTDSLPPPNDPSVPFQHAASFLQVVRQANQSLQTAFSKTHLKDVRERRKAYHAGASRDP